MLLKIVSFESHSGRMGINNAHLFGFDQTGRVYFAMKENDNEYEGEILNPLEIVFVRDKTKDSYIVVKKILATKKMEDWVTNDHFSGGMGNLGQYIGEIDVEVEGEFPSEEEIRAAFHEEYSQAYIDHLFDQDERFVELAWSAFASGYRSRCISEPKLELVGWVKREELKDSREKVQTANMWTKKYSDLEGEIELYERIR